MALLMLLVAVMVSAVIIAAAVTAMKNVKGDSANRQAMLDSSSAAELMKSELNGASYRSVQETVYFDYNHQQVETVRDPVITVTGCSFPELIEEAFRGAESGITYTTELSFTEENMGEVSASFKMDKTGNLYTATVSIKSAGDEKNESLMTVTASGELKTEVSYSGRSGFTTKTVTWSNAEITKGAAG